jgi:hypothetical protein
VNNWTIKANDLDFALDNRQTIVDRFIEDLLGHGFSGFHGKSLEKSVFVREISVICVQSSATPDEM